MWSRQTSPTGTCQSSLLIHWISSCPVHNQWQSHTLTALFILYKWVFVLHSSPKAIRFQCCLFPSDGLVTQQPGNDKTKGFFHCFSLLYGSDFVYCFRPNVHVRVRRRNKQSKWKYRNFTPQKEIDLFLNVFFFVFFLPIMIFCWFV